MHTAYHRDLVAAFAATGRNHPYLAFTLNSLCNLDCVFCKPRCMPDYGHKDRPLTASDYAAIAAEAGAWKIRKAHCSGGEPTLRADILDVIAGLADGLGPDSAIGMTSHGNLRRGLSVEKLHRAYSTYLNLSLHSLDPTRSAAIMGGGDPRTTRRTLDTALSLGLRVKVNCVLQRTYLDDAFAVAELARDLPIAVRLIELQNIGPAQALFDTEFISEADVRSRLHEWFANSRRGPPGPARRPQPRPLPEPQRLGLLRSASSPTPAAPPAPTPTGSRSPPRVWPAPASSTTATSR